jgi:hypothetical protein
LRIKAHICKVAGELLPGSSSVQCPTISGTRLAAARPQSLNHRPLLQDSCRNHMFLVDLFQTAFMEKSRNFLGRYGRRRQTSFSPLAFRQEKPDVRISMELSLALSNDLTHCISDFLTNRDIKSIRLANRQFSSLVQLRFESVFVSPSKRSIEVLELLQAIQNITFKSAKLFGMMPSLRNTTRSLMMKTRR